MKMPKMPNIPPSTIIAVLGATSITVGAGLIYFPASLIVGGGFLLAEAITSGRPTPPSKPEEQ